MNWFLAISISVLSTLQCWGQNSFDFSVNYGGKISVNSYSKLSTNSPNLKKFDFTGLSPSWSFQLGYSHKNVRHSLIYEGWDMWLKSGFSFKPLKNYPGGGAGEMLAFNYYLISLESGFLINESNKFIHSLNARLSFLNLAPNNTNPTGWISERYDSLGVLTDKTIDFADSLVFKHYKNLYVGLNYNLKYMLGNNVFINLNTTYNQGILTLFTGESSYDYYNYKSNNSVHFKQQVKSKLSNLTFSIGFGYVFDIRAYNKT